MSRKVLITGGAGFIGANVADHLLSRGERVVIYDNLSRKGSVENVNWLRSKYGGRFTLIQADIRDFQALEQACAGANLIYHLASQVAVTTSMADPREDFTINALGTFNLLEASRNIAEDPIVVFTSTNKVYGTMPDIGIVERMSRYEYDNLTGGVAENRPLDFHSPYGCSKGAAEQYVRDYYRIYGLKTIVFRQSCVYGYRQFGNEDQGWVAHFLLSSMRKQPIVIYGNGKQTRDVLFIEDLLEAFDMAVEKIDVTAGQIYNIGGGTQNTISLLELISYLDTTFGQKLSHTFADWRPGDQKVYISNLAKARSHFGWSPRCSVEEGMQKLFAWATKNQGLLLPKS